MTGPASSPTNGPQHEGARITEVRGGSAGLASLHAAVRGLADRFDDLGDRLRARARLGPRVMADAELLESAPLSPLTFKDAELAVLAATTGPGGVLPSSAAWEVSAVRVRATVAAFEQTDQLVATTMAALDHHLMRTAGLPVLAGIGAWAAVDPEETQRWLIENPELVERMASGSGGLLDALGDAAGPAAAGWFNLPSFHPTTEAAAGTLAGFFGPEGEPRVRPIEPPSGATTAPTDLAGLLGQLAQVSAEGGEGAIEVQSFTGPDDEPRHIVYLPGTDDLATLPWTQDDTVRDGAANLHLIAGQDTTYVKGVVQAMQQAGVGADEPVMLVGHSQGGMTAAHLATMGLTQEIAHVVTAGAPTAHVTGLPAGTGVLSLEHHGDLVPQLDGAPNADTPHQVTVTFEHGGPDPGGVAAQHGLGHYVAGATATQESAHPSVASALAAISADGFLPAATPAEVQAYQITR